MVNTDANSVKEVLGRLSSAALATSGDSNCIVIKDDLSTILLAYALELNNTSKSSIEQLQLDKINIEQRIVGMAMVVGEFGDNKMLHSPFEVTAEQIYNLCDLTYGGDSQHVRGEQNGH